MNKVFSSDYNYPITIDGKEYKSVSHYSKKDKSKIIKATVVKFLGNKFLFELLLSTELDNLSIDSFNKKLLICLKSLYVMNKQELISGILKFRQTLNKEVKDSLLEKSITELQKIYSDLEEQVEDVSGLKDVNVDYKEDIKNINLLNRNISPDILKNKIASFLGKSDVEEQESEDEEEDEKNMYIGQINDIAYFIDALTSSLNIDFEHFIDINTDDYEDLSNYNKSLLNEFSYSDDYKLILEDLTIDQLEELYDLLEHVSDKIDDYQDAVARLFNRYTDDYDGNEESLEIVYEESLFDEVVLSDYGYNLSDATKYLNYLSEKDRSKQVGKLLKHVNTNEPFDIGKLKFHKTKNI